MSDMASWVSTFIIPVGVSIATVIVINLTVGPRLAARGKRIQENHSARDQFKESPLDLAALCANLRGVAIPDTMEEPRRARFQAERDRWEAQIGDITTWLNRSLAAIRTRIPRTRRILEAHHPLCRRRARRLDIAPAA
jgi:hypothetical protein